ncbi:MAG TPA: VWA domain-containing protein [Pyrinomonadaceae bacterium]
MPSAAATASAGGIHTQRPSSDPAGFVSFAPPASGEVRVENQRGGVDVEVWDEAFVGVASSGVVVGEQKGRRVGRRRQPSSPVRVERSETLLSIHVPRAAGTTASAAAPVDLKLRLPRSARARIYTSDGPIEVRGAPAQLSAQTISGAIRLMLSTDADADITAHSLNGKVSVREGVGAEARLKSEERQKFQTRVGGGASVVRLFSGRGQINLELSGTPDAASVEERTPLPSPPARNERPVEERPAERRAPALVGARGEALRPAPSATPEAPQEVDEDEVIRVDSELVTVNISVVDRARGRGLTGLVQDDFQLAEDGVLQSIEHFEAAAAPFDLVLLIDLSGSTGKVTDLIRAAAVRFIDAARAQDRIAVLAFAGATNVVSPLTTERERLRASVRAMGRPDGHTRVYDSTAAALDFLEKNAGSQRRRAVVLLSDGLDSTMPNVTGIGSQLPYEELRSRVQEFEGLFYSIWTSTEYEAFSPLDIQPETFDLAHDRLQELAEAGGGVFYDVERLEDLAGAYERVVEDLGTVYSLSYRPTNKTRDGRWRAIRVRLPGHPQAVARGKRGYNAN